MWKGFAILRGRLDVLAIASQKGIIGLVVNGGFQVAMVVMAERVFVIGEGGSTSLGLMYAAVGIGHWAGPRPGTPLDARSCGAAADGPDAVLLRHGGRSGPGRPNDQLCALCSLARSCAAWVRGSTGYCRLRCCCCIVPGKVRGRVFSVEFAIFTLVHVPSARPGPAGCWTETSVSVQSLLAIMAAATVLPGLIWAAGLGSRTRPHATNDGI